MADKISTLADIRDCISAEYENKFSLENNAIYTEYKGLSFSIESIFDDYRDMFFEGLVEVNLSEKEFDKFKYKPKYFCEELYGIKDIWRPLLMVNNMVSVTEFNRRRLFIFKSSVIKNIINDIIEKEKIRDRPRKNVIEELV